MQVISDSEALNLERSRQKGVAMLHNKNKWIDNDATINQVIDKCEELNDVSGLIDGTATEIVDNETTHIKDYAFYNMANVKKIRLYNAETSGLSIVSGCGSLEVLDLPALTNLSGNYAGQGCSQLKILYLKSLKTIGSSWIYRSAITKAIIPNCICSSGIFVKGQSAPTILLDSQMSSYSDAIPTTLKIVIIRGDTVPTLSTVNAFPDENTIFYIKQSLVEQMKQETNWSALPNINDRVIALEGTQYEPEDWFESTEEYHLLFD